MLVQKIFSAVGHAVQIEENKLDAVYDQCYEPVWMR